MSQVQATLALLEIILLGLAALLSCGLGPKRLGLVFLPLAWSTGALLVVGLSFACGLLGQLATARFLVPLLGLGLGGLAWRRRSSSGSMAEMAHEVPAAAPASSPTSTLWLIIPAGLLFSGWVHQAGQPYAGDELLIWGRRAVEAVATNDLGADYQRLVEETVARGEQSHADYPLLNSLLQAWMLRPGDELSAVTRLPIQIFDLAALLFVFALVAAQTRNWFLRVMLSALPFMTIWYASPQAMSDRILSFGFLMTLHGLNSGLNRPGRANSMSKADALTLIGFLLLVTTKNEGLVLAGSAAAVRLLLVRGRAEWRRVAILSSPALAACLGHWIWARVHGFENDLVPMSGGGILSVLGSELSAERIPVLLGLFLRDFVLDPFASAYLPIAALLVAVLMIGRPLSAPRAASALLASALVAIVYFVVFLATTYDLKWHWSTAGPRILSQMNLALAWALAVMAGRLLSKDAEASH